MVFGQGRRRTPSSIAPIIAALMPRLFGERLLTEASPQAEPPQIASAAAALSPPPWHGRQCSNGHSPSEGKSRGVEVVSGATRRQTGRRVIRGISLVKQHGELLRGSELFAGLDGVALAKLAARLEVLQLHDGEDIVHHGEPGDALYMISRGNFAVYAGDRKRLRTCGRGELIGEMALLTGEPRSATVLAEGEAEVLRLGRLQFDDLVRDDPSVPLALATTLSARLRTVDEPALEPSPPRPAEPIAAAPLITVALAPVAAGLGIDPWVVAIVALVGTSGFFLPYQSTIYQAVHQELNGRLFQHAQARPVAVLYGALSLLAIVASVPVWHMMGLL